VRTLGKNDAQKMLLSISAAQRFSGAPEENAPLGILRSSSGKWRPGKCSSGAHEELLMSMFLMSS